MDPVTAYGLFCNVITMLDSAVKIARNLKDLYDSSSGFSKEAQRLRDETNHLTTIANDLSATQVQLSSMPQNPLLNKVAKECLEVSGQIQLILVKCKVNSQGPKAVAVFKAWVSSQKAKSELQGLQLELQTSSDRLRNAMALATRAELAALKQSLSNMGKNHSEVMDKLSSISKEVSNQNRIFQDVGQHITFFEEAQNLINHAAIIRALKPLSAHARESEITIHHGKTFEWIIDSESESQGQSNLNNISFGDWLKHGSGVFHFAGKPGSGKSTLFKFIANDCWVCQSVEEWAASANKQLVLSKFFFWRYGSNDQKSISGLLRGLLYEMCVDNPYITKLLLPDLWGKERLQRDFTIKDGDVRTAFHQVCTNQAVRQSFRLCFFIDGLDEFSGEEMTHWKFAKMLQDWTRQSEDSTSTEDFIKLCVSSREDHSIMSVFRTSCQIRLQDITKCDIAAIVKDTLLSNEYFVQLQEKNDAGCKELIRSILQGAEGVFLWVSLLLHLLEDELPGVSSVAALQSIVRTTPVHLEGFISQILDSIRKHHRRGAYFVLAMALRMMGLHLSDNGKFPAAEQNEYEKIFGTEYYWRPYLSIYGLSAVLETLEEGKKSEEYRDVLASLAEQKHETRSQDAAVKVRTWCKGLLDVTSICQQDISRRFDQDLWYNDIESKFSGANQQSELVSESGSESGSESTSNMEQRQFTFVKFTHRSVPDFLMSVIQRRASEYSFDDSDIAKGIIAALIAETASSYNDTLPLSANLAYCLQHELRLLRLRAIPESSPVFPMLEELELARLHAYQRASHPAPERERFSMDLDVPCGSQQEFLVSKDCSVRGSLPADHEAFLPWRSSATVLTHASHAGLHEYIGWKLGNNSGFGDNPALLFSALNGLSTYYSFFWNEYPRCYTSTLRLVLSAGAPLDIPIPGVLDSVHSNDDVTTYLVPIWQAQEFLVAREIVLYPERNRQGPPYFAGWGWVVVLPSIMNALIISTMDREVALQFWEFLEVWLEFGAMPPVHIVCSGFKSLKKRMFHSQTQMEVKYRVPIDSKYRDGAIAVESGFRCNPVSEEVLMCRLGTVEGGNFADLVKSHQPPNAAILLKYIERNLAIFGSKIENVGNAIFENEWYGSVLRILRGRIAPP